MNAPSMEFLLVRMGDRHAGLPMAGLVGVNDMGTVYPVPVRDRVCRGLTENRGRLVPVLWLADLIGDTEGTGACPDVAVVLEVAGRGVCLAVDEAVAIVHGEAMPPPPGESLAWAVGVVRRPEGIVPILDLSALRERLTSVEVPSGVG